MIRIRVVRACEVAVAAAAILLLAVIVALFLRSLTGGEAESASRSANAGEDAAVFYWLGSGSAALGTETADGAERGEAEAAQSAFSASVVQEGDTPLFAPRAKTLRATGEPLAVPEGAPRVLIYHTHTYEAYTMEAGMEYTETEQWRTADMRYNITRVGEALTAALRELGIDAVHDTTNHELPILATAYSRSLSTLTAYADAGEEFDLCIDMHRDAYNEHLGDSFVNAGGRRVAKILFLVGRGENYQARPNLDGNMRFAQRATDALNAETPGLCRPILTKPDRYNQHCGKTAALVEVGNNQNTLTEALNAVPYLARALAEALRAPDSGHTELIPLSSGG